MDKELDEAQKLTKDDLLAKLRKGRPGKLGRRPRDVNQLAAAIVREATEPDEGFPLPTDFSGVVIQGVRFAGTAIEVGDSSKVRIKVS
jgi:hypothetical protein